MKAVCFGEIMLRLTPNLYDRFVQTEKFCASFGGGELKSHVIDITDEGNRIIRFEYDKAKYKKI